MEIEFQLESSDLLTTDILLRSLELGSPTPPIPCTLLSPLLWKNIPEMLIHPLGVTWPVPPLQSGLTEDWKPRKQQQDNQHWGHYNPLLTLLLSSSHSRVSKHFSPTCLLALFVVPSISSWSSCYQRSRCSWPLQEILTQLACALYAFRLCFCPLEWASSAGAPFIVLAQYLQVPARCL